MPSAGTHRTQGQPARRRRRLTILVDHPAQHFSPAFRCLAGSELVDLHVLYGDVRQAGAYDPGFDREVRWDVDLLSGYSWSSLPGGSPGRRLIGTVKELKRRDPELVITYGWGSPVARMGSAWTLTQGWPLLVYGDSSWQHERGGLPGLGRAALLRLLFRLATGALSTGTYNREFYIRHGMCPDRIHAGVCPANLDLYRRDRGTTPPAGREVVIGFAGKLVETKGVDELLSALALIDPAAPWRGVIIGDGPERVKLERLASELGLNHRVEFRGFANQSEMPERLGSCDVVVVPSVLDHRVLIATEAMAAGAVVVVSTATAVWGRGDLVEDGITGLVYQSGDPSHLAEALSSLLAAPERMACLRREASSRLGRHGPEAFARAVDDAVARILA